MSDISAESPKDFDDELARWDAELKSYEQASRQWREDSRDIVKRYALEQTRAITGRGSSDYRNLSGTKFNILYSNVQTMQPALFSQAPIPVVMRRHKDPDPVGRMASQILQRALAAELEDDGFQDCFDRCTLDVLLTGRGVPWVRYDADIREVDGEKVVAGETTPVDYVYWGDFAHAVRKTWEDVKGNGWVARKVNMTKKEGIARFGKKFSRVPLRKADKSADKTDDEKYQVIGTAEVWEIWDVVERETIWLCREYKKGLLDKREDPLGLDGFFPCPQPAYGVLSNESLMPIPDYLQYKPLAEELDDITSQISALLSEIRAFGVFDNSAPQIANLFKEKGNRLVGVDNIADLLAKGGSGNALQNVLSFVDIQPFAVALAGLYDARDRVKQVLYEVTGLSDIFRGQVDPREKLGQSQLKGRFASQRLDKRRSKVEMAARDTLRIKGEIMAEQYSPDTLRALSSYDQLPEIVKLRKRIERGEAPPQAIDGLFQQAIQLLRDEKLRGFRIDVETNSTVSMDEATEKEDRVEFLSAAGSFMEKALPLTQAMPQLTPLIGEMLLFNVRGFKAGRTLEAAFEDVVQRMTQMAENPQPEPPDSSVQTEQMKQQTEQLKQQGVQQKNQVELQKMTQQAGFDQQKHQMDLEKLNAELIKTLTDLGARVQELEAGLVAQAEQNDLAAQSALTKIATQAQTTERPQ